ncbi:glycosyl hydrolase [Marmoricola sp. RAF53]|uniref:glycosyl hydrolase n=1 Tax=Marmoricola sp. RAF53 TaxID=3233059 RepID=UPI003F9AA041
MTRDADPNRARRGAIALSAALALVASAASVLNGGASGAAPAAPSLATATASAGAPGEALTAEAFADPPASVRPMYRWWMPLAYTDDDELRSELRDIAANGAGGVEIAPFIVPGAGNQSSSFLAQYGWGTPLWAHKMEVITAEAAKLGLQVDQNLGPQYPATVPNLNSFNQPEAEQQLIYGREFDDAGSSRTGALPATTTAPPSVTTKLCAPASVGDEVVKVEKLGGMAAGDTVTVGAGGTAEKVVVSDLGDRTAACGDLTISALTQAHDVGESLVNVARTTRIKTVVAQCVAACASGQAGTVSLDPASVVDVSGQVSGGKLDYTFPAGNGNPWVLLDFQQTASGLIAQSGGYTATQPNYVIDHWSRGGARIQGNFWDENILTPAVQKNLDQIGRGAVFEDSLELGSTQKWTWSFLPTFTNLRGYDPSLFLPALAGAGIQATGTPAFDFAGGVGKQFREDYRQTMSDLYSTRYVATMQRWARSHGLDFRAQPYGTPIAAGAASAQLGIPEGESLNFGSPNALGAEQDYRVLSGGAHLSGKNIVSTECCAAFLGNFRSSLAGPNVGGQYGQGGDGTQTGGKYSQGLLDSIYKAYAGGVNQLVWHGYAYRDAPKGVGSAGRDGGTWPGYHPWDIFGVLNVNDEFGPRQASWPDYAKVNDSLARTQFVLRQGRAQVDLGVYYEDLGLIGSSVSGQQTPQHMLGTDSATSKAGYTYEYVAPSFLADPDLEVEADGGLFGDKSDEKALVLNNQTTMSVENAQRLLDLAQEGLRIFVVGDAPTATTGAQPDGARLAGIVTELLAQPSVTRVASEDLLPAALAAGDIVANVTLAEPTSALGLVRRQAGDVSYDFVYNRSATVVEQDLTLSGAGKPYRLNTQTGTITPIAEYGTSDAGVRVHVRVAPYDAVIIALAGSSEAPVASLGVHAVDSTGEVVATGGQGVALRAEAEGTYFTTFSNGVKRRTDVSGLAPSQILGTWTLGAQTWTPGANEYTTAKTDQPEFTVTADQDGRLPSWKDISTPVDLSQSSGIGTYAATVTLPDTWNSTDGAYLNLGAVLDSVTVTVNGTDVTVNQSDRGRIDLGKTLRAGANTVVVRVATTMFNAVRKTGDSNYQSGAWQSTGLMGPVSLAPYRDTVLKTSPDIPPAPVKVSSSTSLKVSPLKLQVGKRAKAVVAVSASKPVTGKVQILIDGKVWKTFTVANGRLTTRMPALMVGNHRVRAIFTGSALVKASTSRVVIVKVVHRRGERR